MNNWSLSCGSLLIMMQFGCGNGAPQPPKLHDVSGTITHTSGPVEKGNVNYSPIAGGVGGQAELQPGGKYSLRITAGEFQVSVTPRLIKTPDTELSPGGEVFEQVDNIPAKYHNLSSSALKATVSEKSLSHDFKLE